MKVAIYLMVGLVVCALAVTPTLAQSIVTDGNIETDAQLVSNVVTGTAPFAVSSNTLVSNLNADRLDGLEAAAFALDVDLETVETLLVALLAQFPELGKVPLPRTGQTTCYNVAGAVIPCGTGIGLGQDGNLQLGVTWPNPRFTTNGDGTVTDNLTGLIWLENADCAAGTMDWEAALAFSNTLFDGSGAHNGGDCGLSDGSGVGEWRLPNVRELQSLVHYGAESPAVPDTSGTGQWSEGDPFSGLVSDLYWSSTTDANSTTTAWYVYFDDGHVYFGAKGLNFFVWPVRGSQ